MLPKRSFLDPRSADEAFAAPFEDAVNIPFDELPHRSYELPPPRHVIRIAGKEGIAEATVEWLAAHGRFGTCYDPKPSSQAYVHGRLWDPNPLLEAHVNHRHAGRAIDLGCGTGRDTVFLASLGWQVHAIDILPDAIAKGRALADRCLGESYGRIMWDCRAARAIENIAEPFDLVVSFYFLDRTALAVALGSLRLGGLLLLEVYTPHHRENHGKPKDLSLTLSAIECRAMLANFEIGLCEESWTDGRHLLRVAAERRQ